MDGAAGAAAPNAAKGVRRNGEEVAVPSALGAASGVPAGAQGTVEFPAIAHDSAQTKENQRRWKFKG